MSSVLILIAALSSFHSNKHNCEQVTDSLIETALYDVFIERSTHIDQDLEAIKKFEIRCQSK